MGEPVGVADGDGLGDPVGVADGDGLGEPVGEPLGDGVGVTEPKVPASTTVVPFLTWIGIPFWITGTF